MITILHNPDITFALGLDLQIKEVNNLTLIIYASTESASSLFSYIFLTK